MRFSFFILFLTFSTLSQSQPLPWWGEVEHVAQQYRIPPSLLYALCQQESNYQYQNGVTGPYPYVVTISGKAKYHTSKDEAKRDLELAIKSGKTNLDIGMCQINYHWHKHRLLSESAEAVDPSVWLEPHENLITAAEIIDELWRSTNDLSKAVGYYHSRKPARYMVHKKGVAEKLKQIRQTLSSSQLQSGD